MWTWLSLPYCNIAVTRRHFCVVQYLCLCVVYRWSMHSYCHCARNKIYKQQNMCVRVSVLSGSSVGSSDLQPVDVIQCTFFHLTPNHGIFYNMFILCAVIDDPISIPTTDHGLKRRGLTQGCALSDIAVHFWDEISPIRQFWGA